MKKKIVVITGAAGFIGRNIAWKFSREGWHTIGIGRGKWQSWSEHGLREWHSVDVTMDSLKRFAGRPDLVIHCAGGSSVGSSVAYPLDDFNLTVNTTTEVLEFIRVYSPLTKLLYPSSAAVYGQVQTIPINENDASNPISPYGVHKKIVEMLCGLYSANYGVSIVIVRLFSVYGEGLQKQLLWDACQKFANGDAIFFGTGDEIRDWIHVNDVAQLFINAEVRASAQCPIINAGSGLGLSTRELLAYVSKQFKKQKVVRFSSKTKVGDPSCYIADISRARSLNWSPSICWTRGVLEYVEWYKKCF